MRPPKLPEPVLVTKSEQLRLMIEQLQQEPIIAVDTESNSLYAYREQVCLVQFSIPNKDYLVDPFAVPDMTELGPIFVDPAIEKVFHAAEYDVICLKRDFGFAFNNIFDTMAAARILGRKAVGLGTLLEREFSVELDKHYQRANWGQRPLPAKMLAYARLDTHYLITLRNLLKKELQEKNLYDLAKEDFDRLRSVNGHNGEEQAPSWWRVRRSNELTPQQAAILQELCQYRERMARTMDRPVFKVINDQTLFEIARQAPKDLQALGRIRGMNEQQVRRHGARLLEAVQRGLNDPPLYPPKTQRPNDHVLQRLDRLRRWRKTTAQSLGVDSDIILPRDLMYTVAEEGPRTSEELDNLLEEVPWRREHFGEQILATVNKR
jgi:ribonuclease D